MTMIDNQRKAGINRRGFLRAGALAMAAPAVIPSAALGLDGETAPSDRIYLGAIGNGGRFMRALMPSFTREPDARIVAVCDCREERRNEAKAGIDERQGNTACKVHKFYGDLLERNDIDAVIVATGDRWHAVLSILAARAGKDVYCEKPFCLTIGEGRLLVESMKQYGAVWQCGTQRRTIPDYRYVIDTVHEGKIGRLQSIVTKLGDWSGNGKAVPGPAIPPGFDYDIWLGQAPWRPYSEVGVNLWRNHWDTGGGVVCDMGPHMYDLAQWGNQSEMEAPVEVSGTAVFPKEGFANVPFEWDLEATYANGVKLFTKMGDKGIRFNGGGGWIEIDDMTGEIRSEPKSLGGRSQPAHMHYNQLSPHIRDFFACIKTRNLTASHPELAHRAHTIAHVSNICLRLGRPVRWDSKAERFIGDGEANRMLSRTMRPPWGV